MEARIKPIPAFYCVYLLRSTIRHSALYIGSTPSPVRRLAQHNGKSKGGAVRTSRASLRPWEMVCIVAGFTSNIAALQFEWAWHNAHITRFIDKEDRVKEAVIKTRINHRTGKTRKKLGRPRAGLGDKLENMHLLLRSDYFSHMPLHLRFFSEDVHKAFLKMTKKLDGQLRSEIEIVLDLKQSALAGSVEDIPTSGQLPAHKTKANLIGKGGVEGVDPTYARHQACLLKLKDQLDSRHPLTCDLCEKRIEPEKDLYNICLDHDCSSMTHLACLATEFLRNDPKPRLIPDAGACPTCQADMKWRELMSVLALRTRGSKEVEKLIRKKGRASSAIAAELMEENSSAESEASDSEQVLDLSSDGDAVQNKSSAKCKKSRSPPKKVGRKVGKASKSPEQTKQISSAREPDVVIEDSEEERMLA